MNRKVSDSAHRLKELMQVLEIGQSDLCKRTGLSKSVVSLYVNGKRDPRQDNLALIAETYNVDPAWLMGFDVPMKKITYSKGTADLLMDSFEDKSTMQVIEIMNKLNNEGREQVVQYAAFILSKLE